MNLNRSAREKLVRALAVAVIEHADELTSLEQAIFAAGGDARAIVAEAAEAAKRTTPMLATRGRASFLGERSIGHMDPGSRSVSLLIGAAVVTLELEAGL